MSARARSDPPVAVGVVFERFCRAVRPGTFVWGGKGAASVQWMPGLNCYRITVDVLPVELASDLDAPVDWPEPRWPSTEHLA